MKLSFIIALFLMAQMPSLAAGPLKLQEENGQFIGIYEGSIPVMRYVCGEILENGATDNRRRSTYVHPLYSVDGRALTDDFPKDHRHHRGLSWMWDRVTCDGTTADLWTIQGIHQRYIDHTSKADGDTLELTVHNGWYFDAGNRKVIDETVRFVVHKSEGSNRIIDYYLKLAAADSPVTIGVSKDGYSGLALRFAPRKETTITTSAGAVKKDEVRHRYAWADLSARFGDSRDFDGVTIFDNKSNPHYPCGWALRFYGLLDPAFTSTSTDWTIQPDKPLELKYRLYMHKGKADIQKLDRMFREYGE